MGMNSQRGSVDPGTPNPRTNFCQEWDRGMLYSVHRYADSGPSLYWTIFTTWLTAKCKAISRKLYSVLSLTNDNVGEDTHSQKFKTRGYANGQVAERGPLCNKIDSKFWILGVSYTHSPLPIKRKFGTKSSMTVCFFPAKLRPDCPFGQETANLTDFRTFGGSHTHSLYRSERNLAWESELIVRCSVINIILIGASCDSHGQKHQIWSHFQIQHLMMVPPSGAETKLNAQLQIFRYRVT